MVSEMELNAVKGELVSIQGKKVVLENKVAGSQQLEEKANFLKDILASLELEKVGLVYKIAMLEHGIMKLKGDVSASSLKKMDLQESMTGLEG